MMHDTSGGRDVGIGQKISAVLSDKGVAGLFRHTRTVLLHSAHERLFSSPAFGPEPVPTTEKVELDGLTIDSDNRQMGVHYAPTPRLIF